MKDKKHKSKRMETKKGQARMEGMAIAVILAAVSIVVGVVIFDAIYRNVVSERFVGESAGNYTSASGRQELTDLLNNPGVYFGNSLSDGTANATATITTNNGSTINLALRCCPLVNASGTFNVTPAGLVTVAAEESSTGEVRVTYSVLKVSEASIGTFNEINDLTYSSWQLAVVGVIVIAAVTILGFLFVLGRRT